MRVSTIEFACLLSLNFDCTVFCCTFVDNCYCFSICLLLFYAFFVCIWGQDALSDFTLANGRHITLLLTFLTATVL